MICRAENIMYAVLPSSRHPCSLYFTGDGPTCHAHYNGSVVRAACDDASHSSVERQGVTKPFSRAFEWAIHSVKSPKGLTRVWAKELFFDSVKQLKPARDLWHVESKVKE